MDTSKLIMIVIAISYFVVIALYDIPLALDKIPGNTISEIMLQYGSKSLLLPAIFGTLMAHFWWPGVYKPPGYITIIFLGLLALMYLGFDLQMILTKGTVKMDGFIDLLRKNPMILFLAHILIGHFLWPQKPIF